MSLHPNDTAAEKMPDHLWLRDEQKNLTYTLRGSGSNSAQETGRGVSTFKLFGFFWAGWLQVGFDVWCLCFCRVGSGWSHHLHGKKLKNNSKEIWSQQKDHRPMGERTGVRVLWHGVMYTKKVLSVPSSFLFLSSFPKVSAQSNFSLSSSLPFFSAVHFVHDPLSSTSTVFFFPATYRLFASSISFS